jgi:hypothetical protein
MTLGAGIEVFGFGTSLRCVDSLLCDSACSSNFGSCDFLVAAADVSP